MTALGVINDALAKDGVTFQLQKIGHRRGEWQILKYVKKLPVTSFLSVLRFLGVPPWSDNDGAEDVVEHIMLESKDTCVVLAVVNDKYVVLTRQHRPIFSRWYREVTRGWEQAEGGAKEILRRKLPRLLGDPERDIPGVAKLDSVVTLLKRVAEDTGLRTNLTSYYLVNTVCDIVKKPGQSEQAALQEQLRDGTGNNMFTPWVFTIEELDNFLVELMAQQNTDTNKGLVDKISIAMWTSYYFYRMNRDRIQNVS